MSNTNIITLETVIARINSSKLSEGRKGLNIDVAKKNADRPQALQDIFAYCEEFDKEWESNVRARMAQSFNIATDNWETPAPDMKADEKKKEEIKMTKEIYRGEEDNEIIAEGFEKGSLGDHTVTLIGIKGNNGWKRLRFVDENNALYETSVWTLKQVDPRSDFVNEDGKPDNYCERARIKKVVCKIIGHGPDGDNYSLCYNNFTKLSGTVVDIIGTLIKEKTPIKCVAVPNPHWNGSEASKEFKLLFSQVKLREDVINEFGGFVDDFSNLPTGDEPETVQYNDHIDSRVKKNFAPRPTEDAAC